MPRGRSLVNHDLSDTIRLRYHSIGTSNILAQITCVATPWYSHHQENGETERAADGKKEISKIMLGGSR